MDPEPLMEQITPRLRRWGNVYELDGEPLRKVVGRAQPRRDRLVVLERLRADAAKLLGNKLPLPDASRVRKVVGRFR